MMLPSLPFDVLCMVMLYVRPGEDTRNFALVSKSCYSALRAALRIGGVVRQRPRRHATSLTQRAIATKCVRDGRLEFVGWLARHGCVPVDALVYFVAQAMKNHDDMFVKRLLELLLGSASDRDFQALAAKIFDMFAPRALYLSRYLLADYLFGLRSACPSIEKLPALDAVMNLFRREHMTRQHVVEYIDYINTKMADISNTEKLKRFVVQSGNLCAVQYMHELGCIPHFDWKSACLAAKSGNLELLQWMYSVGCPKVPLHRFWCAIEKNTAIQGSASRIPLVRFLLTDGYEWTSGLSDLAMRNGHADVVHWVEHQQQQQQQQ